MSDEERGQKGLRPRGGGAKDTRDVVLLRVRLDVRDLRAMQAEMEAIGPVVWTSHQFTGEAASLDEFFEHGSTSLQHLTLRGSTTQGSPALWVDMNPYRVHIATLDRDPPPVVTGVQARLERICRPRSQAWAAMATTVAGLVFALALVWTLLGGLDSGPIGLVVSLVLGALGFLTLFVGLFIKGEILLVSREERPGWLKRNRDALVVQVLGGLIVLLIGVLIGRAMES